MRSFVFSLFALISACHCKVYFSDYFSSENAISKWVSSTHKGDEQGLFEVSAGLVPGDENVKGLRTTQNAKFYGISSTLEEPFSNKGKNLVIQFTVKHEQDIDCGGGYIKLLGSSIDQKDFHGETPYKIMFGPDICGLSTKKVHVIFNYNGVNHLIKEEIRCKDDTLTHLYTLIVYPDNTYKVLIDNVIEKEGALETDWDMLLPKEIPDDSVTKPDDWVDEAEIDDPEDKKPDDWDKPKSIPDSKAKKPDDWDDEMDGEWEVPLIDNPEYKGDWSPRKIANPAYKGPWVQPKTPNPDYKPDENLYMFEDIGTIGFDLWQVKSGTIFGHILITDDVDHAKQEGETRWKPLYEKEKQNKLKADSEAAKKASEDTDSGQSDTSQKSDHDEL